MQNKAASTGRHSLFSPFPQQDTALNNTVDSEYTIAKRSSNNKKYKIRDTETFLKFDVQDTDPQPTIFGNRTDENK